MLSITNKLANANLALTISPVYKEDLMKDTELYEKINESFSYKKLHVTLTCTLMEYAEFLKKYAEEISKIGDIMFTVTRVEKRHEGVYNLWLETDNKIFQDISRTLRNSSLRALEKAEYFGNAFDIDNLHVLIKGDYSVEDINQYIHGLKAKTIFLKQFGNHEKYFEYEFDQ